MNANPSHHKKVTGEVVARGEHRTARTVMGYDAFVQDSAMKPGSGVQGSLPCFLIMRSRT